MTTKNDLQNFGEEFFKKIRENEAWKNISRNEDLPWSLKLIEKHSSKFDWEELSQNDGVKWDAELIEKFKHFINWTAMSGNIIRLVQQPGSFDWNLLKKYEGYWNWYELSKWSGYIPTDIIEQYADNWDWKELIDNRDINWTYDLFERFKNYIPVSDFENLQRSTLWAKLVKIDEQIITGKLLEKV